MDSEVLIKKVNLEWSYKIFQNYWNFRYENLILYKLPFPVISITNFSTALAAICASGFKISKQIICRALKETNLPGRFQIISNSPRIILDVAHNPHAAYYLLKQLKNIKNYKKIHAVVGMLKNKDVKNTLSILTKNINFWYCVPLNTKDTVDAKQYEKFLSENIGFIFNNVKNAFKYAYKIAHKNDLILVFGSFYTVSEIIKYLKCNRL